MSYTKTNWQDLPNQTTPITATRLNNMENGIANSDGAIGVNEYSTSSTYAIGDYCLHDNKLYRCKTEISTAEAWTSGHWTQVKIVDAIDDTQEDLTNATKGYQTSTTGVEHEITDSAEANGKLNIDSGKTNQISTTGKNILEPYNSSSTLNGITCIYDAKEQTYTFNGTCNTDNTYFQFANNEIGFSEGTSSTTFWLSGSVTTFCQIRHYDSAFSSNCNYDIVTLSASNPVISRTRAGTSFTSPANRQTIRFNNGSVATNFKIKIMVTNSTSINVYEPFTGGEPAPSSSYPQDIVSIGDNFNLWGGLTNSYTRVSVGVTFTTNTDGTIDANGTATGTTQSTTFSDANTNGLYVELEAGTYTVSCEEATTGKNIQIIDENGSAIGTVVNTPVTITLAQPQKIILRLATTNGTVFKNETFHIKLERGMNATSYSPLNRGSIGFKVSNKNEAPNNMESQVLNGVTFTKNEDGTIKVNGTANANINLTICSNLELADGTQYKLSGCPANGSTNTYYLQINQYYSGTSHYSIDEGNEINFNYNIASKNSNSVVIVIRNGVTLNNLVFKPMIRKATITNNGYSKYSKQIINVPLPEGMELCKIGNNKDKIVKQDGKWYKYAEIGKIIFDGSETFNLLNTTSSRTAIYSSDISNIKEYSNSNIAPDLICTHFLSTSENSTWIPNYISRLKTDSKLYFILEPEATTSSFKTWLSTNNVTVYYPLAIPTYTEITDTDTLKGLYQIEHILMYKDYTLIECIDEVKPDTHVEYLYNNEVNNTFGGIIAELNARIHALETASE